MGNQTSFLMYQTEDGETKINVRIEDETVWMTQKVIAELFQKGVPTINEHIKNIYIEGELVEEATLRKNRIVQVEGSRKIERVVAHYNLEMILAIGYRVRSHRGTQFRQWATERLNEYLVKGFTMDDERLKEVRNLGQDYFDELLERIKDIRASEKRFYNKITDIYMTSVDYDVNIPATRQFFATVQNKLHYAITGQTAAEIIMGRVDAVKENMGLTSWKGKQVRKGDVTVAKNYLIEEEVKDLNHIVAMYLDFAQLQAKQQNPMYMKDWASKLDAFLQFNGQDVLTHAGIVKSEITKALAQSEYEKYHQKRLENPPKDDFDKFLEQQRLK